MKPQRIIIDGYNVIFTDTTLRRMAIKDRTAAREALIEKLRRYIDGRNVQVTLVFDGRGSLLDAEALVPGRLQVLYTPDGQTADEAIVATLSGARSPRSYIVVTSDMADIGRTARALGCNVIGSKRFLDRIGRGPDEGGDADPEAADEMNDTDYWLRKFSEESDTEDG